MLLWKLLMIASSSVTYVQNLIMRYGMLPTALVLTVNFNKKLAECGWQTKLAGFIRYTYKYILYIPIHIPIYYLFICYIFNSKLWKYCAQLLPDEYKIGVSFGHKGKANTAA